MTGNASEFPTESDAFDQHAKETIILNLQDYGCYYMLASVHEILICRGSHTSYPSIVTNNCKYTDGMLGSPSKRVQCWICYTCYC